MALDSSANDYLGHEDKIAKLSVISYQKLLFKDRAEANVLLRSCINHGFFYLDLGTDDMKSYLQTRNSLFEVAKEYFSRPLEEKLKDSRHEIGGFNICGYKPMGLDHGNIQNKKDGCEGIRVPADLLFCPTANSTPRPIDGLEDEWSLFMDFIGRSHTICKIMLENISDALGLSDKERLENFHKEDFPSTSTAVLQHYPLKDLPPNTSVGHFTHTDAGSISVLYCSDWGLQVYSSQHCRWEYVAPRDNHAIVNVGDALRFISGCRLKSSLHRVVPRNKFWVSGPRYSTIFFLRPNNEVEFTDDSGNHWTGHEWLNRKFDNYRKPHDEQKLNSLATGKIGFIGLLEPLSDVSAAI